MLSSFSLPVGLYQFARNSAFRYLTDLVELYRRVSSQMQSCCSYSCDLTLQSSVLSDFESRRKRRFVLMSVQAETERFRSVENESLLLEGRRTGCGDRAVHGATGRKCLARYELMSTRQFTHATPTIFNAGTDAPQMSSSARLRFSTAPSPTNL